MPVTGIPTLTAKMDKPLRFLCIVSQQSRNTTFWCSEIVTSTAQRYQQKQRPSGASIQFGTHRSHISPLSKSLAVLPTGDRHTSGDKDKPPASSVWKHIRGSHLQLQVFSPLPAIPTSTVQSNPCNGDFDNYLATATDNVIVNGKSNSNESQQ